ncbi:ORF6N domain-containing protein, partial [Chromatium okenii]|uniref:ORF6N domain-containing protein n=1 Tax=Chromatium okenii TaxID=61644 RepID=UPI001902E818
MSALPNSVVIHSIEVQPVEFCGQRVLTFAQIDKLHDRPDGTTKRSFRENKSRLTAGDDFYLIDYTQKDEFRPFGIKIPPRGLIVITESGYLLLVKSFTDDLAWAVQKELVKVYFRAKAMKQPTSAAIPTDLPTALRAYAAEIESHHDDSSMIEMLNQQIEILKE